MDTTQTEDSSHSFSSCVGGSNSNQVSVDAGEQVKSCKSDNQENNEPIADIEWTPEYEVTFFRFLRHHRPIGLARHFQMMLIVDKFSNAIGKPVSAQQLWDRLSTYYNLKMLDESEQQDEAPTETDFDLEPHVLYSDLQSKPFPRVGESDSDLDQPLAACLPGRGIESDVQSMSTDALSISNMGESCSRASTPNPTSTANSVTSSHRRNTRNKRSTLGDEDSKSSSKAGTPLGAPGVVGSGRSNRKRNSKA